MNKNFDKIKKLKSKLNDLCNNNRIPKTQSEFSHVSLGGLIVPGKFNFDKKNQQLLNKMLGKALDSGLIYSIAEMPKDYGPVKADIDLNFPQDEFKEGRLYNNDTILQIIDIYRDAIKKYCDVNDNNLNCFVFEKEAYHIKNGDIKDGFHLIFPYLTLHKKIRHLIVNSVIEKVNEKEMFSHLSNPNAVDKQTVSSNPWMMYGCAKPNCNPYKLKKVLDKDNNEVNNDLTSCDIIKLLSLRNKRWSEDNKTELNKDIDVDEIEENYSKLSIDHNEKKNINIISEDRIEEITKANKLVDMLSHKRAHNYGSWIRVGWALHNTDKSLLDKWIEFSKRSKKFKPGECESLWKSMRDDGITSRSLMKWASLDNLQEYNQFLKDTFESILKKNTPNNTYGIAEALKFKYYDRYVCIAVKENLWYEFKEHRWRRCPNGGSLIIRMSREFSNYYINEATKCNIKAMEAQGADKKKNNDEAIMYNKIASSLMDINFKERIIKEAKNLFYDDKFLDRMDENHQLIGFENGVYDLDMKKFRPGMPDDHITLSTKVDYIEWKDTNPYAKKLTAFFKTVLTNDNVREYFLSRLSSCVSGKCEERFYFCTGSGSNGKSLTFQLLGEALGDYYISCPITIITRKRGASSAASPELARLKGPRAGVFQEPGTEEELNVGIFKELSGNDRFMVRGLYKEPIEVKPQVKYWLTCNDLPKVTSDDGGTWRRIRVIDFSSKFMDDPDPDDPNQFKIDLSLKEQILKWAPYFASYLINKYVTEYNTTNKFPEPEEVMVSTNRYRKDQDIFRDYYDNNIEEFDSIEGIKKRDLYTGFKLFFKNEHEGEQIPKSKKLYEFMEKAMKKDYNYKFGYQGIRFKTECEASDDEQNDLDN
uniref:SF3 helicase domain-containing protein n=1 Tax=viral metagenome TaxID=1070528 RepID=A0A6C0J3J8_9ZZZZ